MKIRITAVLLALMVILLMAGCAGQPIAPSSQGAAESDQSEAATDTGADMSKEPYIIAMAGYRTGPFQHTGTPVGNGTQDATAWINQQGGIDGWPVKLMEIETGYDTPRGVEAYDTRSGTSVQVLFWGALKALFR